jgi:hypothetical protein
VLNEGAIDYHWVGSPPVLLVFYILCPEAIIVVVVVQWLNERLWGGVSWVWIGLELEVSHYLFHLWLDLILSDVELLLHDLSSLALSAVLI